MFKDQLNCNYALCLESGRPFAHFPSQNRVTSVDAVVSNLFMYSDRNTTANNSQAKYIIPMLKTQSGIYEIPIILNNTVRISFIFDSGASDVTISPDVAMVLFRSGTVDKSDYIGTQTYVFADGSTAECDVFNIKEINIGGMILKNVTASISNSMDAPMLMGQSVMQRLGKYSIDNTTHCLIIE
jgi:aspartyl protease family protein